MPASSRLCPSATCYLPASTSTLSPPRRRRPFRHVLPPHRLVPRMGQLPSAPSGRSRSRNRSSSRWPPPALRLDLGFLLGRKPRSGSERLELANWMRCFLLPPLPLPTAEAEAEAEATAEEEGRIAGSREEEEADHLVVMVNGLNGSSADWKFAAEQFEKRLPGKVYVHRSQCNHLKLTYDGVDVMGERLAEEVRQVVQTRRNLRKISFVAHSLGGLVSRYAFGKLYEPSISEESCLNIDKHSDEQKLYEGGKIAGLEPINFIASATPHLGSRWNKQVRFGAILYATLGTKTNLSVGVKNVPTAKLNHVDNGNSEGHQQEDSIESSLVDSLEEMMIHGLTQVTWERVDVCFHKSWLRYNAHNNIQVLKKGVLQMIGVEVGKGLNLPL